MEPFCGVIVLWVDRSRCRRSFFLGVAVLPWLLWGAWRAGWFAWARRSFGELSRGLDEYGLTSVKAVKYVWSPLKFRRVWKAGAKTFVPAQSDAILAGVICSAVPGQKRIFASRFCFAVRARFTPFEHRFCPAVPCLFTRPSPETIK